MSTDTSSTITPTTTSMKKSPWTFFLLVFILSTPFVLLGAHSDRSFPKALGLNIPISGLMLVCPFVAAVILVYREEHLAGVSALVQRILDLKRIRDKLWYLPVFFLMPLIMLLSYGVARLLGMPLSEPHLSWVTVLTVPILFVLFFIGAIGEEVGWTGYAIDPMQARWNALGGALIVGSMWGLWHTITYMQAGNPPAWVAAQVSGTLVLRILIVWLYNNTGKSLFAAISFHAMVNVSESLFPQFGPQYNPIVTASLMAAIAVIIISIWGPKTLTRRRYTSLRRVITN